MEVGATPRAPKRKRAHTGSDKPITSMVVHFSPTSFGEPLHHGLDKLCFNPFLSDVVIVLGEERLPAHAAVLCACSPVLKDRILAQRIPQQKAPELEIDEPETDRLFFKKMIEFMYKGETGTIQVATDGTSDGAKRAVLDGAAKLLAIAARYGVTALREACGRILGLAVEHDNLEAMLELAARHDCRSLDAAVGSFLADRFAQLIKRDKASLMRLRSSTWAGMLADDRLKASSEERVYEVVLEYSDQFEGQPPIGGGTMPSTSSSSRGETRAPSGSGKGKERVTGGPTRAAPSLSSSSSPCWLTQSIENDPKPRTRKEEVLAELLPHIRFTAMSGQYLVEHVESNPAVADLPVVRRLLYQTYRHRMDPTLPLPPSFPGPRIVTRLRKGFYLLKWAPSDLTTYQLSNNGSTLTKIDKTAIISTVRTAQSFTKGHHMWDVLLDKHPGGDFQVGVINATFGTWGGWMKQQAGAVIVEVSPGERYIRVELDMSTPTVKFYSSSGGLLHSASNIGSPIYPAVSMRQVGCKATIVSRSLEMDDWEELQREMEADGEEEEEEEANM